VDRLLLDLDRSLLDPGSTIILDEASMCGSRKLARLLDHAAASRSKLLLVGDTKQLSSVDVGGGFRGLAARLGAHRLPENRRQVERWERDALHDLREGRVRAAMTAYVATAACTWATARSWSGRSWRLVGRPRRRRGGDAGVELARRHRAERAGAGARHGRDELRPARTPPRPRQTLGIEPSASSYHTLKPGPIRDLCAIGSPISSLTNLRG
jgi:hypothetical protein